MKKTLLLGLALVTTGTAAAQTNLTGAGASFPYPLYSKMFAEYRDTTGVNVNYQSIGSGAGSSEVPSRAM